MKKVLLVLVLITSFVVSSCGKDSKDEPEGSTEKTSEVTNENESNKVVIEEGNIYDGINRIAISFYGETDTQIGLSWYTAGQDQFFGTDVQVIEKSTMTEVTIDYEIEAGIAEYDDDSVYHQTLLKGLKENTEYYFRIGDEAAGKWSEYGSFKTSSKNIDEFTFVAVTDTQSEHLPDAYFSNATIEKALEMAKDSAFIMHSGDYVEDGDDEELWLAQMNASKKVLMNNIIAPAVGNHEEDEHSFWQHFKIEHTNDHKTTGAYYSYDYGKVHFVVLDTNKVNDDNTSYIDDEQLEWLEEDLIAANANGAQWIIVNMHKGLYTIGEHSDNDKFDGENGARLRVGKIFEEQGVDLVIQGHDHCPSVTKPIIQGKVKDDGVIYVNTGSAGTKAYSLDDELMSNEYYELFDYMADDDRGDDTYQNFAVVEVSKDKLVMKLYEMNLLANENNLYIIDEIVIENEKN